MTILYAPIGTFGSEATRYRVRRRRAIRRYSASWTRKFLMNPSPSAQFRIGHGWDLHRLEPHPPQGRGRPLVLGGITFDHPAGPVSHSDGDVVYHAVTDAILGS